MSGLLRWLKSWSRRSQARSASTLAESVFADFLPCRQGILLMGNVGRECCIGHVRGYSSEASSSTSSWRWLCSSTMCLCHARSLCSSTMCLCLADSVVECSENYHTAETLDFQGNGSIANMKIDSISHLNTDIANIDGNEIEERQSTAFAAHYICVADGKAWPLQQNAKVEGETVIFHASAAALESMDSLGMTELMSEGLHRLQKQHNCPSLSNTHISIEDFLHAQHSEALVSNTKDAKEEPRRLEDRRVEHRVEEISYGDDDFEHNDEIAELLLNVDALTGFPKGATSSQDAKIIEDICNLLESRGWEASTEAFLNKHYSQLTHLSVGKIINRQRNFALAKPFYKWACRQLGHDLYVCHAYLLKLGQNKHFDEMWEILNTMKDNNLRANETSFCIMIKSYGFAHMPDMAVEVFTKLNDHGVASGTHVLTTLISVFFKSRWLDEARLCYSKMLVDGMKLDAHTYSTLIRGFGKLRCMKDAQICFNTMLADGVEVDLATLNSLIEGFCWNNAMNSAMAAFSAIEKRGLKPNTSTFNMLIKAFCKAGKLQDATNVLVSMKGVYPPNQATFNILLQGLLANQETSKAIEIFKFMRKEGWVDARSYIYLSNGLRQVKQTGKILDLLRSLLDVDGFANVEVCNSLIYNLSHLGKLDEAEKIFRELITASTSPNVYSYATMIGSYCSAQKLQEAVELLIELKQHGCKPNSSCYIPIVVRMLKMDRVGDALEYVEEMLDLGLVVNSITCDFLLKMLCRRGMVENVMKVGDIIVDKRLTLCVDTLFEYMKCLCMHCSIEAANTRFRIMDSKHVLPKCKAVFQALAVMDNMCSFDNEE